MIRREDQLSDVQVNSSGGGHNAAEAPMSARVPAYPSIKAPGLRPSAPPSARACRPVQNSTESVLEDHVLVTNQ